MNDYYNLYIELSIKQCAKTDYDNRNMVRAHNAAMKKLNQLQKKMELNIDTCSSVLAKLLDYEDERVRINAATQCIKLGICKTKAINLLKEIENKSIDPMCRFNAKMVLQNFSPKE